MKREWENIRDRKLAEQHKLLAPYLVDEKLVPSPDDMNDVSEFIDTSEILSTSEKKITNLKVIQLIEAYRSGSLSARVVTEAYCKRATLAHQLTNCLTEVRFKEALEEATELDLFFEQHKCLKGPLHGVIISVKDNINVKGLASSMGFVGESVDVKPQDSKFVELLKELGGIVICKTNTSAGMVYSETTNVLWGRTLNPFNRLYLNVGGSSGGEGALNALKGSCFGIGSDIGGSVRHPSALNMLYSLKPCGGRFPKYGTVSGQQGQESIISVYGIMTHHVSNLQYVCEQIIKSNPSRIDASCIPLGFRPPVVKEKLKIGFMVSDGLTTITTPVQRGLNMVKDALRAQGHIIVDWPDTYFKEIRSTIYPFYGADGMKHVKLILAKYDEPPDYHIEKPLADGVDINVSDLWKSQTQRSELAQKYFNLWNSGGVDDQPLDAVISACSPFPGCLWNKVTPQPLNAIWNALDYSAGTFPVTRCDPAIDKPDNRTKFISETDQMVYELYRDNLDKFTGGPVSLQVVCPKLQEELCVALIKYISELL